MAARGRKPSEFYVYRIFDGFETVYVGKGSGRRLDHQKRKFGLPGEIVEGCKSDDHAFSREVFWIKQLQPTSNKLRGGNGGRVRPKPICRDEKRFLKELAEIDRIGSRRYAARMLLKFDTRGYIGSSKLDVIRQVANGPRC